MSKKVIMKCNFYNYTTGDVSYTAHSFHPQSPKQYKYYPLKLYYCKIVIIYSKKKQYRCMGSSVI